MESQLDVGLVGEALLVVAEVYEVEIDVVDFQVEPFAEFLEVKALMELQALNFIPPQAKSNPYLFY